MADGNIARGNWFAHGIREICNALFGSTKPWVHIPAWKSWRCRLCGAAVAHSDRSAHEVLHLKQLPSDIMAVLRLGGELAEWRTTLQKTYPHRMTRVVGGKW